MFNNKQRFMLLLISFFIIVFTLYAQTQSVDTNSLREGAWALQFGVSSNFTLTSFQGSTLSLKYQLSDKSAIRGGITLNGRVRDYNGSQHGFYADASVVTFPDNNSMNNQDISFVIQYLSYLNSSTPIHLYWGIGPLFSYSYSKSSSDNSYSYYSTSGIWRRDTYSSSSSLWGIGVSGSIGVEWFPIQWLSLRAEYGEYIQYQWGSSSGTDDERYTNNYYPPLHSEDAQTIKDWSINNSYVGLGLNVYW